MSALQELLEKYGVDYAATLPRFLNDEKLYLRCFDLYLQDDNLEKLKAALACGNLEEAFFCAHTLKGVVGNMGFTFMYTAVSAIVEPLRAKKADEDYEKLLAALINEAETVLKLKAEVGQAV